MPSNWRRWTWLFSFLTIVVAFGHAPRAQQPAAVPDISGSYERYRGPSAPPPAPAPPLKAQYLSEWQSRVRAVREAEAKGEPLAGFVTSCLPEGMPSMMAGPFPLEILQSKGQVTIIQEAFTQVRRILLDQPQKPIEEIEPSFYGRSVGRWMGDALVVDTVGIKENVRYQNVPHSKDLRIKERIRSVASDIVWDEVTLEDPAILEKPWTFTFAWKRTPGYTLLEYICEDNREYADDQGRQKMRVPPAK
jgi:hypothetical protein